MFVRRQGYYYEYNYNLIYMKFLKEWGKVKRLTDCVLIVIEVTIRTRNFKVSAELCALRVPLFASIFTL